MLHESYILYCNHYIRSERGREVVNPLISLSWWRYQRRHFPRYWPFVPETRRWPVNSLHKVQWRGALMFSLISARTNSWVNNRDAGDLRRHRAHYDVIVMVFDVFVFSPVFTGGHIDHFMAMLAVNWLWPSSSRGILYGLIGDMSLTICPSKFKFHRISLLIKAVSDQETATNICTCLDSTACNDRFISISRRTKWNSDRIYITGVKEMGLGRIISMSFIHQWPFRHRFNKTNLPIT